MAYEETFEGTPKQLVEQLRSLPDSQKYRMTLAVDAPAEPETESLETAIARISSRTPEEISADRARILSATPPPRELPEGTTIFDAVMGKWPGNETDKQIFEALENLS